MRRIHRGVDVALVIIVEGLDVTSLDIDVLDGTSVAVLDLIGSGQPDQGGHRDDRELHGTVAVSKVVFVEGC